MIETLARIVGAVRWLLGVVRSPLRVGVSGLALEKILNDGGPVIVITPHPVRYRAAVRITNRAGRAVSIRDIRLRVADRTLSPGPLPIKRLDADDYADLDLVFPVSDQKSPAEAGRFTIQVLPTRGRTARAGGAFPFRDADRR